MMVKRATKVVPVEPWWRGTLINVLGIPIVTTIFLGSGFYYLTQNTLAEHTLAIAQEATKREALQTAQDEKREALRVALRDYAAKTSDGINKLAAHADVQDERIKNINEAVDRLVTGFQRWDKQRSDLQRGG